MCCDLLLCLGLESPDAAWRRRPLDAGQQDWAVTAAAPTRHVDVCYSCVHRNTEPVLFCSAKLDWIQEKKYTSGPDRLVETWVVPH